MHRGVESCHWASPIGLNTRGTGTRRPASSPKMRKPIRQPSEGNDSRTMTRFVSSYACELHGSRNVNADRSYNVDGQCRFTRSLTFFGCAISPGFLPSFPILSSNFFPLGLKSLQCCLLVPRFETGREDHPFFSSSENFLLLEMEMRDTARLDQFSRVWRINNSRDGSK